MIASSAPWSSTPSLTALLISEALSVCPLVLETLLNAGDTAAGWLLFQDLLWRSVDDVLDMDKQGGMGNIPMHQAKVLDRRSRLEGEIGNLEAVFGHEHLHQMVTSVRDIRALLRVKMEDSNDLQVPCAVRRVPPPSSLQARSHRPRPSVHNSPNAPASCSRVTSFASTRHAMRRRGWWRP